ncbi:hypothetical protein EVG20_g4262 [Dentipellis fragilis]|uniref:Peptidase S9 prolyl oligopeptidase catalytic domain-containing protein n=1 Tax=Dentipellis fragilis TaxID=205917 RepID=A0A4Y9YWN6_9AGAM|nr:hypothetical protein EVG20_g4262 [Dentipellis fragilis]
MTIPPGTDSAWRVELSSKWDARSQYMRESSISWPPHFLLIVRTLLFRSLWHLSLPEPSETVAEPIDFEKSWPSSYADGGQVSWSAAFSDATGNIKVSFPDIRWDTLRATEGWPALQHHSVLHTTLTVHPSDNASQAPQLLFDLKQGTFFTIVPRLPNSELSDSVPEWYAGNVYNMERSLPQAVQLPSPPSLSSPTVYDVYVSGDYEIRLFGDPRSGGSECPVLDITLSVQSESPAIGFIREPSHDIVCDFVDGFAFGDALGVGLRSISGWWTVTSASIPGPSERGLTVQLVKKLRLAPGQTRIFPLQIHQTAPFDSDTLGIQIDLMSGTVTAQVYIEFSISQQSQTQWRQHATPPIRASYFFAQSMPTVFLVHSPFSPTPYGETPKPPILATHGAGVDIIDQPFWAEALPRQERSWIIMPTGLTSWGLDWHGPSAQEAWATVGALGAILERNPAWHSWKLADNTKVVLLGHSNGGQGTWYLASRYPDRVVAAIPAAGYIKAQSYVPLTQSRSAHFIDPSLRAVLETAFTPDDNDLFLSNLVDTPILAIHGGDDTNVPTWHTREAVSVLKTWNPDANVTYHEDPGESHWYPKVFANDHVQKFLDSVFELQGSEASPTKGFTLTVSNPAESGSLHGWRITGLHIPGRIARLTVQDEAGVISISSQNVKSFSLDRRRTPAPKLVVDGVDILLTQLHGNIARIESGLNGWQVQEAANLINLPQKSGRLATILTTPGPLQIIVPNITSQSRELSIAQRLAYNLNLFHKLDTEIISDAEALQRLQDHNMGLGNIIVISPAAGRFARHCLKPVPAKTSFDISDTPDGPVLRFRGQVLNEHSQGTLFLQPHPSNPSGVMLFMIGNDAEGLERAARLFPIRTGISAPDWLVVGGMADIFGAAGVQGAGVWGEGWSWNKAISWHD